MTEQAEEKYRTLVRTAPDAIFLTDIESGRIVEVNPRAEELLGYDQAELEGRPVVDLHPEDRRQAYRERFERTVEHEVTEFSTLPDGQQVYVLDADGDRIPVEVHARVIELDDGRYVYSIIRDLTERKERERKVRELADELAVVNRIVRHDIRNDMDVVLAWLNELRSELGEDHRETLDLLIRRSRAVVELTDTVRDYVDVLQSDAEPDLKDVRIDEIVQQEATATNRSYDEATVTVDDVPAVEVRATSMLTSVFRNLLHNAVQHNDKDEPKVEVTASEDDATVTVHVADNGPGIPDRQKEEIFGKGEKGLDSSGSGIGLHLVDELVTQFGGDVRVSDNEPEGTVFSVELQRA